MVSVFCLVCVLLVREEALIYLQTFDSVMRSGVKGSKAPVEVMEYAGIKERSEALIKSVKYEKGTRTVNDDDEVEVEPVLVVDGLGDKPSRGQPPQNRRRETFGR